MKKKRELKLKPKMKPSDREYYVNRIRAVSPTLAEIIETPMSELSNYSHNMKRVKK